jgi:mitotic-spindle organizing protein 1
MIEYFQVVCFFWPPRSFGTFKVAQLARAQKLKVGITNVSRLILVMDMNNVAQGDKAMDTLFSISKILDTGLDKETLRILVGLCETGINPEALALIVKELRREAAAIKAPTQAAGAGNS